MDKIFDDSDFIVYRFPCDCKAQDHSMDIYSETPENGEPFVCINLYMAGKSQFVYRLKQAWRSFRGVDGQIADFCIRPEDIPHIIAVLKTALPKYTDRTG